MTSEHRDDCKNFIRNVNTFSMSRPNMSNIVQLYLMLKKDKQNWNIENDKRVFTKRFGIQHIGNEYEK